MFTICKDFTFSAAHAIRGHTRGCENLHGHNYRVRVHLRATELDSLGMVLDFADLKAIMQQVVAPFDHHVINEIPPFDRRNTTAELLSEYFFAEVSRRLERSPGPTGSEDDPAASPDPVRRRRVGVSRVEVWENESSCAVYEP